MTSSFTFGRRTTHAAIGAGAPRLAIACALAATTLTSVADAAPPYVERGITVPRHDWAFNFGLGLDHGYPPSRVGPGLNFDVGVGVDRGFELGFRGGVRLGDTARGLRADAAGRLFDTETYGTGHNTFTNPEVRFRWRFVDGAVGEVGLEGRAYLPFEDGTRFGMLAGLPVALHFGHGVRLDTGVYVPILFYNPAVTLLSIPVRVWFQASPKLWLGPISAIRIGSGNWAYLPAPVPTGETRTSLLLGFGLGYSVAPMADLKFQALFPRITETEGARNFALGFGAEVRIE